MNRVLQPFSVHDLIKIQIEKSQLKSIICYMLK